MVKGITRRVVMIKPKGDEVFEQAIFIVRDDAAKEVSEEKVLSEACRIADNCLKQRRRITKPQIYTVLSAACGASVVGLAWYICSVIP